MLGEMRRRRTSSASMHSASPPSPNGSSSPARSGSLMRHPSFNAATLTYISTTPPTTTSHSKLTRRRSSSSASSSSHSSNPNVPSSYLPTLSATLIYSRYIESGSEMEVDIPDQLRADYHDMITPPSPSAAASSSPGVELQLAAEREEHVIHELEAALRDKIAEQLYAAWQLDCMQYALMRLPVAGGTMYAHHPWRFVLRERRREERDEREKEEELRRAEEAEEAEVRRRMEVVRKERRRSASGFINRPQQQQDAEEHKVVAGGAGAGRARRMSLTHRVSVSNKGLLLV